MRFDRFTEKAQEAVLDARTIAEEYNHPAIEPEHLLAALLRQDGGVVPAVVARIGVAVGSLNTAVEQALVARPRATAAPSNSIHLAKPPPCWTRPSPSRAG